MDDLAVPVSAGEGQVDGAAFGLLESWSMDREIVLVKVLKHQRAKVFAAWMDPAALSQWYGPDGLSIESHEADMREGGFWRFDLMGIYEGRQQRFPNLMRFIQIVPNERIVIDYGGEDGGPNGFYMVVTFDEQADGKTILTMRQRRRTFHRNLSACSVLWTVGGAPE